MGEWSKKVGEKGEAVVYDFLDMIGWGDAQKGHEIDCRNSKHKSDDGKTPRRTHGIDYYFPAKSYLADETLDHHIISAKYSAKEYGSIKNRFKGDFLDLAQTLDCFNKSDLKISTTKQFRGIKETRNIGVLFWLTHTGNEDVISQVYNTPRLNESAYQSIFVIDNYRASFIWDVIRYMRENYKNESYGFFYPDTGRNINSTTRVHKGKILPVEFINSPPSCPSK